MKYLTFLISFVVITSFIYAQDANKNVDESTEITTLVETQRFVFVAESADPMKGRTIFLSPGYTFKVSPDTVISDLPYYGRSYSAPMGSSDGGIKFTSTDFSYTPKVTKKGWDIAVKPKDVSNAPQMILSVSSKGYASLRVSSIDRQSISFSGRIKKS